MAYTSGALHGLDEPISELLPSSPPMPVSTMGSRKPKKPPPITPKRFTRFFTPRNTRQGSTNSKSLTKSARQLQDITRSKLNRANNTPPKTTPRKKVDFADVMANPVETPVRSLKRKTGYMSPETSPAQSSPSKRSRYVTPPPFTVAPPAFTILEDTEEARSYPTAIRRIRTMGGPSRILQRSFGGASDIGRGFREDHCSTWQDQTSNFYSTSTDYHQLNVGSLPFSTTSCNTISMVAVGDEDGWVHLLDAEEDADFTKAHVSFKAHTNAIMDMQFSSDDMYIATASGDQTAAILDARTQQCLHVLAKHGSSVKQVRFQPGDDKMVATSSRDGAVNIWDLRCKGGNNNVHSVWGPDAPYASSTRTLSSAHSDNGVMNYPGTNVKDSSKMEAPARLSTTVTSLSFLPTGREHLLLTASDASTCIKLWDIRGRYSLRGPSIPISTTRIPESHTKHRHFAINSLTLSGDESRIYALSKDNTVYAYSTNHLVLGHAPELSKSTSHKSKYCGVGQEGLGPMYGFRHQNFHAGSFYVKASLRKATNDQPELLAVGSTDGCPVLFPTDEKALRREIFNDEDDDDLPSGPSTTRHSSNGSKFPSLLNDTIPIYNHGTPLIRGHDAEVTGVTWARNGTLVSVGDDCKVRHWKEGGQARELRLGGESGGKRWQSGWAAVGDGFDDEDE